jgi:osmotically-inducible protein OsmY
MPRILHLVLLAAIAAGAGTARTSFAATQEEGRISHQRRSNDDVRKEILISLAQEPQLKGLSISVKVDTQRVLLGGRVHTIAQRDVALKIARDHADGRQVIDDFEVIH